MIGINGNSDNSTSIILIDSNSLEILDKYKLGNNFKTISFDYDSHKLLLSKRIQHILSDEYLSDEMNVKIQKDAYKFARWYCEDKIRDHLEYDGINFGQLFYDETLYDFLKIIKKFSEVHQIANTFPDSKFYASGILYDIVSMFTKHVIKVEIKNKTHVFGTERIRFNFGIGNRYFVVFISRSSYLKLKKLSDSITTRFFSVKSNKKRNLMLVDFHTTRYRDFFFKSKEFPVNLLLHNRRRPPIWNLSSFLILKKASCSIISPTSDRVKNHELERTIFQRINKIWLNDGFLQKFFSVDKVSIWNVVKPFLRTLFERRINEAIVEILRTQEIFEKYKLDAVLVLSEIGFIEQIIVNEAKKINIPVFLMQEGFHWNTKEANEMNRSQGVYPVDADIFLTWSKLDEKDAIENGNISPDRIRTVGACRYDSLLEKENLREEYILLATVGPQPEDIHGLRVQNIINYENEISEICRIVKKLNKKLVVKMHPSPDELDITNLVRQIDPNIIVITSGDILPLIQNCSTMIVMHLSTAIIEAQILQKPVICIPTIDYKWGTPEIFKSKSCLISTIESLENDLRKILHDSDFKQDLVDGGRKFIEKNFGEIGNASKKIYQIITNYNK